MDNIIVNNCNYTRFVFAYNMYVCTTGSLAVYNGTHLNGNLHGMIKFTHTATALVANLQST